MKTYEKPVLVALSLSGNDRLCGECTDEAKKNGFNSVQLLHNNIGLSSGILTLASLQDLITDGITENDFDSVFGTVDACSKPVDIYCKFSGSAMNTVAWS